MRSRSIPKRAPPFLDYILIQDLLGNVLKIQISKFQLDVDLEFDCVSLSARYDHGFGFSQLFRFVDDKESKEIEAICDVSNEEVAPRLLPPGVSKNWRVIVTPVIKSNEPRYMDFYRQLMLDVIKQAQSVFATKLLFSQYGMMMAHKRHQFDGVIQALNELKKETFGSLELIRFEVEPSHLRSIHQQFSRGLA